MKIGEIKQKAREDLKGHWIKVALAYFVILVSIYALNYGFTLFEDRLNVAVKIVIIAATIYAIATALFGMNSIILKVARNKKICLKESIVSGVKYGMSVVWGFVSKNLLTIPLFILGCTLFVIGFAASLALTVGAIFFAFTLFMGMIVGFSEMDPTAYIKSIGLMLLLFVGLDLMIISFSILLKRAFDYFLVYFMKIDYPEKKTRTLFNKSKELMNGNRAQAFTLSFSFIHWILLAFVPVIVANLIWLPNYELGKFVINVPTIVKLIVDIISLFLISFVVAYEQMSKYELYEEHNPQEIYNETYTKKIAAEGYGKWVALIIIAIVCIGLVFSPILKLLMT